MGVVGSQSSRVSKSVFLFMLCALLFVFCDFVGAQQASKIPRVGYISGRDASSPGPLVEAFRRGLRELGYIEGKISSSSIATLRPSSMSFSESSLNLSS